MSSYAIAVDHITPLREGGTDDASNLRAVHWICNLSRGSQPKHASLLELEDEFWRESWRAAQAGGMTAEEWLASLQQDA